MTTLIGPHLLGRIPSTPDERDYRLIDYLGVSPLDAALKVLMASHAAAATKAYILAAHPLLKALEPPQPPGPTPPPPPPPTPATTDVIWNNPSVPLDQGNYGTCVGNGWAQWGNTDPVEDHFTEKDARAIYLQATVFDGQPDDPDRPGGGQQGSSVRSGAKAVQKLGRLSAYAFAASVDEVRAWLQNHGPVVFGTNWTGAMFTPGADGYVVPNGPVEGGHCYVARGDLVTEDACLFENSWGAGWGLGGMFKMKWADVEKLYSQGGEACVALETALP